MLLTGAQRPPRRHRRGTETSRGSSHTQGGQGPARLSGSGFPWAQVPSLEGQARAPGGPGQLLRGHKKSGAGARPVAYKHRHEARLPAEEQARSDELGSQRRETVPQPEVQSGLREGHVQQGRPRGAGPAELLLEEAGPSEAEQEAITAAGT